MDKYRVADKKRTNKPTNTHYSFIGIDIKQNYGSIKNYNCEFHAQKQTSGSLNFLDLDNSIIS